MKTENFDAMLSFFKALANEGRLRIVGLLARAPHSVKALSQELALTEPTVCHHLRKLQDAGLIEQRDQHYILKAETVFRLGESIFGKEAALTRLQPDETDWERRVLANYLEGDQLTRIPASRRKRWAVLHWLADKFREGQSYPEAAVNEIIQAHHWDSATLRREMIGYRMLNRSAGIYWRQPEEEWVTHPA